MIELYEFNSCLYEKVGEKQIQSFLLYEFDKLLNDGIERSVLDDIDFDECLNVKKYCI